MASIYTITDTGIQAGRLYGNILGLLYLKTCRKLVTFNNNKLISVGGSGGYQGYGDHDPYRYNIMP
jgi:hypothetical protein